MKALAVILLALTLTACGEPEYIIYGSKELSVLEHKIKHDACSTEWQAYKVTEKDGWANLFVDEDGKSQGIIDVDREPKYVAAEQYDICYMNYLVDNNIQIVQR
ncbi:hypothetical protein [Colwellia piezophila]|uniref:hypothetical protein n=1 Tax=Colwellia piezophila TaxID=211668 RepID=UPI0003735439|nr:hypothetical protein [Colwellia piezophila]